MKQFLSILLAMWVSPTTESQDFKRLRENMVRSQIESRGITHNLTLNTMRKVERHLFVPAAHRKRAYEDTPLPIGYGQTISQPFIVAEMTQLLAPKKGYRVLEIGAGSGYQAAVLGEIVQEVYTIEIVKNLGEQTKKLMRELGYNNVHVIIGDGYQGYKKKAPYDAIIVTAAAEEIPDPLIEQLKEGGKMIIPIGAAADVQNLMLLEKKEGKLLKTALTPVRFVPFTRGND
ncbi:protein-L-isoaspartate(D-aspartate) O-methyltransferase [Olivibacter sp. SDN3]|uniref:protein-L-isoaspartate(D-aspartate) O-methyltransferase n=1 Tax=Olivibacter sp. SDN3 TaxID=2764720 RepID=UPI001650E9C0|nr:protein-L-isoaspartate(D-aspartate) O-methyltransferase [Olivibacter sp. SDN3]QNL50208.1 protein-L-isoaspartate(D-aspartate) O-methyltransferase [Olivibacter sp. SDN3]